MPTTAPNPLADWPCDGCLQLDDALTGDYLTQVQTAFDRCVTLAKDQWLEDVATGSAPAAFFDIPTPLAQDPLFIDLVDHPVWNSLLQELMDGQAVFHFAQFRTVPPSPLSYVGWHFDVPHTNPLHLKVQIYLNDVGPGQGAFAYVPGSHLATAGPYPSVDQLNDMPGHRIFYARAGTAMLFDSYGMHTSMVNRGPSPRRSIILIYEKFTEERHDPNRCAQLAPQLTTPERRRLFGLER